MEQITDQSGDKGFSIFQEKTVTVEKAIIKFTFSGPATSLMSIASKGGAARKVRVLDNEQQEAS